MYPGFQKAFGYIILAVALGACQKPQTPSAGLKPDLISNPFARPKKESATGEARTKALETIEALDGVPFELKNQCARQLCGEPGATISESAIRTGRGVDANQADAFLGYELGAAFGRIQKLTAAIELAAASRIESALPRIQNLDLSAPYTAVLNFIWAISKTSDSKISSAMKVDGQRVSFDRDKLTAATKDWTVDEREAFQGMVLDLFNSPEVTRLSRISSLGIRDYIVFGTGKSVQAFANEIIDSILKLQKRFPELGIRVPQTILDLKVKSEISARLEKDIRNTTMLQFISRAIEEKSAIWTSRKIPVAAIAEKARSGQLLPKLRLFLSSPESLARANSHQELACRLKIAQTILASPTAAELAAARNRLLLVKEGALRFALSLNPSAEFERYITNKISAIEFELPTERDQTVETIKSVLREREDVLAAQQGSLDGFSDNALLLHLSQLLEQGWDSTGLESTCDGLGAKGIVDRALLLYSKVHVGWATVRFPDLQGGVIGHELGHVISYHMNSFEQSSSRRLQLNKCIDERHGDSVKLTVNPYQEEDFADQAGSFVMNELTSKAEPTRNFGCLLMGEDGKRWGTNNGLMMKWPPIIASASHSPELYRSLQVEFATKGSIPPSCQDLVGRFFPSAVARCSF